MKEFEQILSALESIPPLPIPDNLTLVALLEELLTKDFEAVHRGATTSYEPLRMALDACKLRATRTAQIIIQAIHNYDLARSKAMEAKADKPDASLWYALEQLLMLDPAHPWVLQHFPERVDVIRARLR